MRIDLIILGFIIGFGIFINIIIFIWVYYPQIKKELGRMLNLEEEIPITAFKRKGD